MRHLDLFSGIGGFSLAAEAAGFKTIAFCEIDPEASLVLNHHWPHVPNLKDITKLCLRAYDCESDPTDTEYVWCNRCEADFGDCECIGADAFVDEYGFPDIITGGVPCQPASALGLQRGTADERWLWPDTIRVMRELRPKFGVFENPPALLALERGSAWNGILSGLVAIGYDLWWDVFPAGAFGAGHQRERVILVASDPDRERRSEERISLLDGASCGQDIRRQPAQNHRQALVSSYADSKGLGGHSEHGAKGEGREGPRRPIAPPDLRGRVSGRDWWHEANTGVPVMADGISPKLVEAASRCAGNSVCPQALMPIMETLASTFRR